MNPCSGLAQTRRLGYSEKVARDLRARDIKHQPDAAGQDWGRRHVARDASPRNVLLVLVHS